MILVLQLGLGESRPAFDAPVNGAEFPVDESLLDEGAEDLEDARLVRRVQRSGAGTLVGLEVPAGAKNLEIKPYGIGGLTTDVNESSIDPLQSSSTPLQRSCPDSRHPYSHPVPTTASMSKKPVTQALI